MGSIPGLGRSPGGGNGNPLQYSCLEYPKYRETWMGIVHKSDTTKATEHTGIVQGRAQKMCWLNDEVQFCCGILES